MHILRVIVLGAICELEDLSASPPIVSPPTMAERAGSAWRHVRLKTGGVLGLSGVRPFFTTVPKNMKQAQREEWLESGSVHFQLKEFADLSDGRRVIWSSDRGWLGSYSESGDSPWQLISGRELTKQTMLVLEPDDGTRWVNYVIEELAHVSGVRVTPDSVQAAPFRVEFGPRLQRELQKRKLTP